MCENNWERRLWKWAVCEVFVVACLWCRDYFSDFGDFLGFSFLLVFKK